MNEYASLWSAVYQQYPDIVFAMAVSMITGAVSHLHNYRRQRPRLFSFYEFTADVLSAGVLGFVIIMGAAHLIVAGYLKLSPFAIGAIIPIAGWSAPRVLSRLNKRLINSIRLDTELPDDRRPD